MENLSLRIHKISLTQIGGLYGFYSCAPLERNIGFATLIATVGAERIYFRLCEGFRSRSAWDAFRGKDPATKASPERKKEISYMASKIKLLERNRIPSLFPEVSATRTTVAQREKWFVHMSAKQM